MVKTGLIQKILQLVSHCGHCHPMSGCVMGDLMLLHPSAIEPYLRTLDLPALERILSCHDRCPYRQRVEMLL